MDYNRRDFLELAGVASLAAVLPSLGALTEGERKPNFIVVMSDDCSAREFGCYGHPGHQTPHIDRMARNGVMFETCWCTPICSPTRAQMMTGKYGFRTRWFHNDLKDGKTPLSNNHIVFSQMLKDQGYATAICGKWQIPGTYEQHGFDEHCMWISGGKKPRPGFDGPIEKWDNTNGRPPSGFLNNRAARYWHPQISLNGKLRKTTKDDYGPDIFVDFLLDFAKRKKDRPFFIYFPMALPHKSWDFDRGVAGWLPTPKLDADENRVSGQSRPGLKSNVEYKDYLMGRIVRELTKLGLMDNTILFITGDNGTGGYGKGQVDMEKGPRVPFVVYGPGHVKALGRSNALVNHCDIFATLRDLSGATLPADYVIDGHSFAPLLQGKSFKERDWIFSYYKFERMLRDKRWLLDGNGRFYDCGDRRDERDYRDVTDSTDPEVLAARKRFAAILEKLPAPDPNDPIVKAYHQKKGKGKHGVKFVIPKQTTLKLGPEPVPMECRSFETLETVATTMLSHTDSALKAEVAVAVDALPDPQTVENVWGRTDGIEISLYAPHVGSLITHVFPDGSTEFSSNVKGTQTPRTLKPGKISVTTHRTESGWTAQVQFHAALFGGKLPKSLKLNIGGFRTGKQPGWFAWMNKGRENFRPKNQGVLKLR